MKAKSKTTFAKMEKLESAAKEFIGAFRGVLGDDYNKSEAEQEMKAIDDLIEKLKTKYVKK